MTKVIFATSNVGKLKEAQEVLGIEVIGRELPIEEIQSLDTKKVALEKARAYYKEIKEPLFVEDVALTFNAMNGLPGTYINDFSKALNNEGLDRKSTRLNSSHTVNIVCRLLLGEKRFS